MLTEATNFAATRDDGQPLDVTTEPTDVSRSSLALVDLAAGPLLRRTRQTIRLTYDLPSLPPRSDGLTRINDAFATFTAFVLGDPGITSVQIVAARRATRSRSSATT